MLKPEWLSDVITKVASNLLNVTLAEEITEWKWKKCSGLKNLSCPASDLQLLWSSLFIDILKRQKGLESKSETFIAK